MSSAFLHKQVTVSKAKKRAWEAYSIYRRTLWTLAGFVLCYTCDKHLILKGPAGQRVTVGHWIEGHGNVSFIDDNYNRPQCFYCNIMIGGNQGEFRDRIRKELGDKKVDELILAAKQTVDRNAQYWLDQAAYYKVKLQELTS
jgi:hypothetical protein